MKIEHIQIGKFLNVVRKKNETFDEKFSSSPIFLAPRQKCVSEDSKTITKKLVEKIVNIFFFHENKFNQNLTKKWKIKFKKHLW